MSRMKTTAPERLMTPAEVGAAFRVDPKTVTRWAKAGKLHPVITPGGTRRYRAAEVEAFLKAGQVSVTADTGVGRRWQVQQPVPICTVEKCRPFEGLVWNGDGAHKAALGHTAVTGHETWVAETSIAIYDRPGGGM